MAGSRIWRSAPFALLLASCAATRPAELAPPPELAAPPPETGVLALPRLPLSDDAARALIQAVGDARVVFLGESSHGAGNAFAWRAAVVELLRREMGFEHLVVESSFYDCRRAYHEAQRHRDPVRLGRECAFDIWSEAVEAEPLWQTVVDGPMQLWGMDPQLSGDVDSWLIDDMQELATVLQPGHDANVMRQTLAAIRDDDIARTPEQREAGRTLLVSLRDAFAAASEVAPPSESRGFWSRNLDSLVAIEEDYWLYQQSGGQIDDTQHNLRERQMAANLLWLLRRSPRERFVVWLHTAHAARNVTELGVVDHGDHQHDFRRSLSLGDLVASELEPDPLVLSTVSTEGRWALAGKPSSGEVPPQPSHGLGDRLRAEGIDRALIDLRIASRTWPWIGAPLSAPILGMEPTSARWPRHVDVLLFDRVMTPATSRADRDLIGGR